MILASAHPKGFSKGMHEVAILTLLSKAHAWVSEQQGRAMHIGNGSS
jgi:hypothetical protein